MSDLVRFGILGLGMGSVRAETATKTPGAELACVCSLDEAQAIEWASKLDCDWTTRYEEIASGRMLAVVEQLTESALDPATRERLTQGPREIDFVYSALAETMEVSYRHICELWRSQDLPDLRVAALAFAIRRVGEIYQAQGIFP